MQRKIGIALFILILLAGIGYYLHKEEYGIPRIIRKDGKTHVTMKPYRCDECGRLHGKKPVEYRGQQLCTGCGRSDRSDSPFYDRCGKAIEGNRFYSGGKQYCTSCNDAEIPQACAGCGVSAPGDVSFCRGNPLCSDCRQRRQQDKPEETDTLYCSRCKQSLHGKYRTLDGRSFCQACFEAAAPQCDVCGKNLAQERRYRRSAIGGRAFCRDCGEAHGRCRDCGLPVAPATHYPNSAYPLCRHCASTAVITQNKLEQLYAEAVETVKQSCGIYVTLPMELVKFGSNEELKSHPIAYIPGDMIPNGSCNTTFRRSADGGQYVDDIIVYIKYGMSEEETFHTLCHEYAHAWDMVCGAKGKDIELCEGFAEWIAYKCLLYRNCDERAQVLEKNTDEIYGGGLRKFLQLEQRLGHDGAINYIKDHSSF